MATLKDFSIFDTLIFNGINLDILTETFNTNFYGKYIAKWQDVCTSIINCTGKIQSYQLAKIEGDEFSPDKKNWHGHVTAITVSPESRRQGQAKFLMDFLEKITTFNYNGYYIDLFVRPSNAIAIAMYQAFGYNIYQTVNKYYSSASSKSEDAYDMRKSLPRDKNKQLSQPTNKKIEPEQLEFH